ncbi:hypothetical protein ABFY60_06080 [Lysinibacillus pakistanensis]|uniref:hypothetical protein n=1 Tax=Lysinibacillus pakistanensis TaxID=759811 RepID=UPI003D2A1D44
MSDQHHVAAAPSALRFRTKKQHVAAAALALRFRTKNNMLLPLQLRHGEIDFLV